MQLKLRHVPRTQTSHVSAFARENIPGALCLVAQLAADGLISLAATMRGLRPISRARVKALRSASAFVM
jgi:hypothetical protein